MGRRGLVSIIIPVYNSGERLAECLESVVTQSYPAIEVIIVDDCSTDGSLEICREYETKYPFIHVYTKENKGVSAARNFGIAKAEGEYLQFADSDDRLEPDACRQLVECMERDGSDLVVGGYYNEKQRRDNRYPERRYGSRTEFIREFPTLFSRFFLHVPWNKLYRREKIQAQFPEDLCKGEDLLFNLQVFSQVEKISVLGEVLYFYHNTGDGTLSFRFREDAMEIEERLYIAVRDFYTENGGGDLAFLEQFYLEAIKNKFYALTGKSGYNRKKCCEIIREWIARDTVRSLYDKRKGFCVKDRILLFLMRHTCVFLLYLYYKP